jgi:hypothetical protein
MSKSEEAHVRRRCLTVPGAGPGVIDAEGYHAQTYTFDNDIQTKHAGYHTAEVSVTLRYFFASLVCIEGDRWAAEGLGSLVRHLHIFSCQ